jgi:hypothetical protein
MEFEMKRNVKLVNERPVAKFFYKRNHTHPVRRTVLVTEESRDCIKGYELREGKTVRTGSKAPLKSYSKKDIAVYGDYSRLTQNAKFVRLNLLDLVNEGV